MKLNKHLIRLLKAKGISKINVNTNYILSLCKNFKVEDFSEEELCVINKMISQGSDKNYYNIIYDYCMKKYSDSDVYNKLYDIIEDENADYEFADNFRISDGSPIDEFVYHILECNGCCGSYDDTVEHDGVKYKIGFNYGH